MSQENVEIVRRAFEACEDDEEAPAPDLLDPDLVWYPIEDGHIPARGIDGAKGVRHNAGSTPGRTLHRLPRT